MMKTKSRNLLFQGMMPTSRIPVRPLSSPAPFLPYLEQEANLFSFQSLPDSGFTQRRSVHLLWTVPNWSRWEGIHVSLRLRQVCMRLGNFRDKHTTFICAAFSNIQRLSKYTATSEPHINSILQIIALARSSCADLSWLSVCTWQISRACSVKHIRVLYKIPPIGDWEEKTTPVSASFSLS